MIGVRPRFIVRDLFTTFLRTIQTVYTNLVLVSVTIRLQSDKVYSTLADRQIISNERLRFFGAAWLKLVVVRVSVTLKLR